MATDRTLNIDNLKLFVRERIKESNPNIDTRDNLAVGDLLIDPLVAVLQPLIDAVQAIQDRLSLINPDVLLDADVDALAANLLLTRRTGGKSGGLVRVYFESPQDAEFLVGQPFRSDGGLRFLASSAISVDQFTMRSNVEGGLYFIDTPVQSEDALTTSNLNAEEIVAIEGGPPGVVQVTNKSAFTGGADRETNDQLIVRMGIAVAVRDLVTANSISTVVLENFPSVKSIKVVGYGDAEMTRDLLSGTDLVLGGQDFGSAGGLNIGGKVDPYIQGTSLSEEEIDIVDIKDFIRLRAKDSEDEIVTLDNVLYVDSFVRPMVEIVRIEELDPGTGEPSGVIWTEGVEFEYLHQRTALALSVKERAQIHLLDLAKAGFDIRFTYKSSGLVQEVQTYMDDAIRRVVTADILVKNTLPATVSVSATVSLVTGTTKTTEDLKDIVEDYIESLTVGETLEVSDIIKLLYDNEATYVSLDTLAVSVKVRGVTGSVTTTTVTDTFVPSKNVGYLVGTVTIAATT